MKKRLIYCMLFSAVLVLLLPACGNHQAEDSTENREDAVLSESDYTVTAYDIPMEDIYCFLMCASDRIYYTAGVQELMDDACRTVPVYAYDCETGENTQIKLPYDDNWHLYAMTPTADGGFWMVFTPVTPGTTLGYIAQPAYLVKTDEEFHELLSIDLSGYSNELVNILGALYPKDSQYAEDMLEDGYQAEQAPCDYFCTPELAVDAAGRVYITSVLEKVIVFDNNGTFLKEIDTYDPEYAQGISLAQLQDGSIAVTRCDGDANNRIFVIDQDSLEIEKTYDLNTSSLSYESRSTPVQSLLPEYDLFACGYYGLYGVNLTDGEDIQLMPLIYYDACGIPEDGTGKIWSHAGKNSILFDHITYDDSQNKHFTLYAVDFADSLNQ